MGAFLEWAVHQPRAIATALMFILSTGLLFSEKIRRTSLTFRLTVLIVIASTGSFLLQVAQFAVGAQSVGQLFESRRTRTLRMATERCGNDGLLSPLPLDARGSPHGTFLQQRLGVYCSAQAPVQSFYLVRARNRTCLYDPQSDLLSSVQALETPAPRLTRPGSLFSGPIMASTWLQGMSLRFDNRPAVRMSSDMVSGQSVMTVGGIAAQRELCR